MFKTDTMQKYADNGIVIPDHDREFFCKMWARYSQIIQPELDEDEVFDIMERFFDSHPITVESMFLLAELVQSTRFISGKDTWQ